MEQLQGDLRKAVWQRLWAGELTQLQLAEMAGFRQAYISNFLSGRRGDPCTWFVHSYPRFRTKRILRFAFDHFQSDVLFNLLLGTKVMRTAASIVYFHRTGVFDPAAGDPSTPWRTHYAQEERPESEGER